MSTSVTLRHNFETAHRILGLAPKCASLHGHSWHVQVTVTAPHLDARGTVVEFGDFKAALRGWLDTYLDHGTMLHEDDPLCDVLEAHGCKVWRCQHPPTVENTAALVAVQAQGALVLTEHADGAAVTAVQVTETGTNEATWEAPGWAGRSLPHRRGDAEVLPV
jgi:6-pyruvoyltetrahydropterin/6-carboxytetrahydropterin synthase